MFNLFKSNKNSSNHSIKILLIEDSPVDREAIKGILKKNNYSVTAVADGEAGFRSLKENKPRLIILDGVLEHESGIDVCRRIKNNPDLRDIPVIFLTGLDTPTNIVDCYEAGAEQYLRKPISAKELLKQVETSLK
jgi:CheY-like chemotaxis protein